jgi:hypothetical protein
MKARRVKDACGDACDACHVRGRNTRGGRWKSEFCRPLTTRVMSYYGTYPRIEGNDRWNSFEDESTLETPGFVNWHAS